MDVGRLRGRRDPGMQQRARDVLSGDNHTEKNCLVLSMAADELLSTHLRAVKVSEKADILSWRQIMRRKQREVLIGDRVWMVDSAHAFGGRPSGRRVRQIDGER
jgi:hypothetical protein